MSADLDNTSAATECLPGLRSRGFEVGREVLCIISLGGTVRYIS
jgi:hypothetical protein